jgi:hypothetical protein
LHNPLDFEWVFCYILSVSTHEETMSFVKYKGYTREDALASVGAGWAGLINRVYDVLESIKGTVKIVQVKEKFGGLRIYTDYGNDELDQVIREVGYESVKICETCGKPGEVRGKGWYYTSCVEHAKPGDLTHGNDDAEEEN